MDIENRLVVTRDGGGENGQRSKETTFQLWSKYAMGV